MTIPTTGPPPKRSAQHAARRAHTHHMTPSKWGFAARSTQCPHPPQDPLQVGAHSTQHTVLQDHKIEDSNGFNQKDSCLNPCRIWQAHVTRRHQTTITQGREREREMFKSLVSLNTVVLRHRYSNNNNNSSSDDRRVAMHVLVWISEGGKGR